MARCVEEVCLTPSMEVYLRIFLEIWVCPSLAASGWVEASLIMIGLPKVKKGNFTHLAFYRILLAQK